MEPSSKQIKKWIDKGRDPRTAHWQAALDALLDVFSAISEPGRLIPALELEENEQLVYNEALEVIDISPNVEAVFLHPAVAGKISPPQSAAELLRIDKDKPSYKILMKRPGAEPRIASMEISSFAHNPGVDLFQDGALLGTYDFKERKECIDSISQIIRAHMWEKGSWKVKDYRRYALNWFERVIDTGKGTISVQTDFSYFHTPSLIRSNPVDVIFILIGDIFERRMQENNGLIHQSLEPVYQIKDKQARAARFSEMAEKIVLHFLNIIKEFELFDFTQFSKKQTNDFKLATEALIRKIAHEMKNAGPE
jgi:hypothetical protein